MLGKLIKYEMKACSKLYLPLILLVAVLTVLNKIFMSFDFLNGTVLPTLSMVVYVLSMIAIALSVLVVTVQRYYTHLLGNEGYLIFTLPVRPWQITLSRLIPALIWGAIITLVTSGSIFLLVVNMEGLSQFWLELQEMFAMLTFNEYANGIGFILEFVLLMLTGGAMSISMIYASISIGQLVDKRRLIASFGAFIGFTFVMELLVVGVFNVLNQVDILTDITIGSVGALHIVLWTLIAYSTVFTVGYLALSNTVLKRKLNLL